MYEMFKPTFVGKKKINKILSVCHLLNFAQRMVRVNFLVVCLKSTDQMVNTDLTASGCLIWIYMCTWPSIS